MGAPIVLYNIPGRTQVDLAVDTTVRVCEAAPNVVATKEATGNILRAQELKRALGDRLTVLSGDDGLTLGMMAVGGAGVISVTSNLYPDKVSEVVRLAASNRWADALRAHQRLLPVHDAMFVDANPGPAKAVLAAKGYMTKDTRLPLVVRRPVRPSSACWPRCAPTRPRSDMNIAIIGAAGRMGLAIVRLAIAAGDSIVGAADNG